MKPQPSKDPAALRNAAEARLKQRAANDRPQTEADLRRLQRELEVHQIELEMQNEELQRSERNYREFFNATNEAVFLGDAATGRLLEVNHSTLCLYGYESRGEILARNIGDLSANEPPYTRQEAQRRIRMALEQGPRFSNGWRARRMAAVSGRRYPCAALRSAARGASWR